MYRLRFGRSFDIAALSSLTIGTLIALAHLSLAPRDLSGGVAVVFPPWTGPAATFDGAVTAGGRFVRFGGLPFIAVVMPDDAEYLVRIRTSGGWFVANPLALAACLSNFQRLVK